ncbi:MAG: ribose ABC transporter [Candidatus Dormibacteraeota bacterium]|nr:ribose ABC transporter [Candidatus Dormibacteraeota bacterium]MBO0744197.1 ribose ABC transporter [Candidatus Dormibacteraeota bacterium]
MLKGIDPVLGPDLLTALYLMGHGDEIALVDAHFPAASTAARTTFGQLIRADGGGVPRVLRAVVSVLELDTFVDVAAWRMEVDGAPDELPPVQVEMRSVLEREAGSEHRLGSLTRSDFYERAGAVYAVVVTGETRPWGNVILRKGVTPAPPGATEPLHTIADW